MRIACECWSSRCRERVEVPDDLLEWALAAGDVFILADGCPQGPGPGDELLRRELGFSVYRSTDPRCGPLREG